MADIAYVNGKPVDATPEERSTRLYREWFGVTHRTAYKSHCFDMYTKYGIKCCDEWMNSFQSFKKWALANGYADDLIIDRVNTFGDYEPNNCRWTTIKENNRNRRDTVFVEYNGENRKLCEVIEESGIPYGIVYSRLRNGWDLDKALSERIRPRSKNKPKRIKTTNEVLLVRRLTELIKETDNESLKERWTNIIDRINGVNNKSKKRRLKA